MPMYVFAKASTSVHFGGGIVRINESQVWPADDPFVRAHPELFTDTPHLLSSTVDPRGEVRRPVEAATKAPGEKRAWRG